MVAMEDITMELSREDFGQLLLMVGIGDFIRGAVMESREGVPGDEGVLLGKLMSVAEKNGFSDAQMHEGHIYPSLEFEQKQMEFIEEYNDGEFWSELEHRLGRRDFERSMTEEDRQYMEK